MSLPLLLARNQYSGCVRLLGEHAELTDRWIGGVGANPSQPSSTNVRLDWKPTGICHEFHQGLDPG